MVGVDIAALDPPIHEYKHGPLGISIIGGAVYRGTNYPALAGNYVFGDFSTAFGSPDGALYHLAETRPGIWQRFEFKLPGAAGSDATSRASARTNPAKSICSARPISAPAACPPTSAGCAALISDLFAIRDALAKGTPPDLWELAEPVATGPSPKTFDLGEFLPPPRLRHRPGPRRPRPARPARQGPQKNRLAPPVREIAARDFSTQGKRAGCRERAGYRIAKSGCYHSGTGPLLVIRFRLIDRDGLPEETEPGSARLIGRGSTPHRLRYKPPRPR